MSIKMYSMTIFLYLPIYHNIFILSNRIYSFVSKKFYKHQQLYYMEMLFDHETPAYNYSY